MPECETRYFGPVFFDEPAVIVFPAGLPGFAHCRRFLPLEEPARKPLIFLQSLEDPQLCFLTLPIAVVDPGYQLKMSFEDLALIGLAQLPASEDLAQCLVIVAVSDHRFPTANLLAPIVLNRVTGQAVQAVRDDSVYSCRHPLVPLGEVSACS